MAKRTEVKQQQVQLPEQPVAEPESPEIVGLAMHRTSEGYSACRISTRGAVVHLGPKKADGTPRYETKARAMARVIDAFKDEHAPPSALRFRT